jgi:hypothetical protein
MSRAGSASAQRNLRKSCSKALKAVDVDCEALLGACARNLRK